MLKCPVCSGTDIPEDSQTCETCNTDLTSIHQVRELAKAQYNEALQLARSGARDAALSRAASALALDPLFTSARKLMGKLLWQAGAFAQAVDHWEQALASAPEDKEIKELLSEARRQGYIRTAKRAAVVALVVVGILLLVTVPMRSQGSRLDEVAAALADRKAYRDAHSHSDEEYSSLEARLREEEEAATEATRELAQYGQQYSHPDTEFAELAQRAESYTERLDVAQQAIDAERGLGEQLAVQLAALEKDYRSLLGSLLPLVSALRPAHADQSAANIRAMEAKCEWLRAEDQAVRLQAGSRDATARHRNLVSQLQAAERQLTSLRADYKRRVEPWKTAVHRMTAKLEELPKPEMETVAPSEETKTGEQAAGAKPGAQRGAPSGEQAQREAEAVTQADETKAE